MKLFLDDLRFPPDSSWTLVNNVRDCIRFLRAVNVEVETLSLDHDLGDHAFGHGIHVINWLEREVFLYGDTGVLPSRIVVHSQNPVGRENIVRAIESIERRLDRWPK